MMAGVFGLFPTVMTIGNRYVAFYDDNDMREREGETEREREREREWERERKRERETETERWQSPQVDKYTIKLTNLSQECCNCVLTECTFSYNNK